jgi:hypothetical protein
MKSLLLKNGNRNILTPQERLLNAQNGAAEIGAF